MNHLNDCLACNSNGCINFIDYEKKFFCCNNCNSIFSKNEISNVSISEKTESYIKSKFIIKIAEINTKYYIQYLKLKSSFKFKNALDVGTRFGTFVKQLNHENINAYGIESNQKLINKSVTNKIIWKKFDSNFFPNQKYDLVCLTSSIFYIRDNFTLLKQVKNILSKNGLVFIVTFNPLSTLIKHDLLRITEENSQMIFSKEIYASLEKSIGLKLIDYTTAYSNFYNDLDVSRNKFLTFLKYFLKFKQPYTCHPDGNHSFVLLSNTGD